MKKSLIIRSITDKDFLAKLDKVINEESVESVQYSMSGSIYTALVITNEGKHGRKTTGSRVSSKSNSDN